MRATLHTTTGPFDLGQPTRTRMVADDTIEVEYERRGIDGTPLGMVLQTDTQQVTTRIFNGEPLRPSDPVHVVQRLTLSFGTAKEVSDGPR